MGLGQKIVETVGKIFGFGTNLTDPKQADIKTIKRLRYQLEASHNYIFVNEKAGEFKEITDERKNDLFLHYRKQSFDSA